MSTLKDNNVTVMVTRTRATNHNLGYPDMYFATTDGDTDKDVSEVVQRVGLLEGGITQVGVQVWGKCG